MSDNDEQFPQRWGFRRKDSDVDSSSDDQSRPSSVSVPKRKKHKLATRLFPDENDQETLHSPQLHPGGRNPSSQDEANKELIKSCKNQERKSTTMRTGRKVSGNEPSNGSLNDLKEHMECLVEGVKVAREDLLKWMNIEMKKSFKDDKTSKPAKKEQRRGSKGAQESNSKRIRTPISNRNKARKTSGTITQNPEDGSSDKLAIETRICHETSEIVVVPLNEPDENAVTRKTTVEKNRKQKPKEKKLGSSAKKQKIPKGNQQTDKAPEAPSANASTQRTLPTMFPGQEAGNSEKTNSGGGNGERDTWSKNESMMNQAIKFTPRFQQKNGMFGHSDLRNVGDYEQNTVHANGNIRMTGNGNEFPFSFPSQGLNGGIGMPNSKFVSQFGLQYLSQEGIIAGLRMNGGPFSS